MKSNIFFGKYVLCALALFGFSSATAMYDDLYRTIGFAGDPQKAAVMRGLVEKHEEIGVDTQHIHPFHQYTRIGEFNLTLMDTATTPPWDKLTVPPVFRDADVIVIVLNKVACNDNGRNLNLLKAFMEKVQEYAKQDVDCVTVVTYQYLTTNPFDAYLMPVLNYCEEKNIPLLDVGTYTDDNGADMAYVGIGNLEEIIYRYVSDAKHNKNKSGMIYLTDGNEHREKKCCS
jgi:hypothetical protein